MKRNTWIILAVLLVAALLVALPAICQPPPPGDTGGGPGMGGPGGPPGGGLAVGAQGVYVTMGPQVYRLDPETLKVLAKAELPRPERPDNAGKPAGN